MLCLPRIALIMATRAIRIPPVSQFAGRQAMEGETLQEYAGTCGAGDGLALMCKIWNDESCERHCTSR